MYIELTCFNLRIDKFQRDTLSTFSLIIKQKIILIKDEERFIGVILDKLTVLVYLSLIT